VSFRLEQSFPHLWKKLWKSPRFPAIEAKKSDFLALFGRAKLVDAHSAGLSGMTAP
jgi:hypothetical protein